MSGTGAMLDKADTTIAALKSEIRRYKEREEHFAKALAVADGGQYRNDWDGAIERLLHDREALREALELALTDEFWPNVVAKATAALSSLPPPMSNDNAEAAAYIEAGEEMRDVLEDAWEHAPADMKDRIGRALGGWNNTYHVHHANGAAQRIQGVVAAARKLGEEILAEARESGVECDARLNTTEKSLLDVLGIKWRSTENR